MPNSKKIKLSGWGNYKPVECAVYRPEKAREISALWRSHASSLIARGLGRSYGDAALNPEGVISSERLNRFIDFDAEKGIITAEGGVSLAEILNVTILKGWFLPVIPGTKYASLGGAIACNIHGKNHYAKGDLAEHILSLKLCLASGESIECSKDKNPEIFWATCGGLGMTGYIERAVLQLIPIESTSLTSWRVKAKNIEEMAALFRAHRADSDYMIGWINHFASGKNLGAGIFEKSRHAKLYEGEPLGKYKEKEPGITIPKFFPSFVLNKYSMAVYNRTRFFGVSEKGKEEKRSFAEFFHPLDSLNHWHRLYGRHGFLQYQFMVPEGKNAVIDMQNILQMIQDSGLFSFLAVIKYHRRGKGFMTFPIEGFSIALDFPAEGKIFPLLDRIDEELCKIGGRIYLAKDARAKPGMIERMYGDNFRTWKKIIRELDPQNKINSGMAERLGFK